MSPTPRPTKLKAKQSTSTVAAIATGVAGGVASPATLFLSMYSLYLLMNGESTVSTRGDGLASPNTSEGSSVNERSARTTGFHPVYRSSTPMNTHALPEAAPSRRRPTTRDSQSPAMGPLHGIKVIDMTSVLMGPFALAVARRHGRGRDQGRAAAKATSCARSARRGIRNGPDVPQHQSQQAQHRARPEAAGRRARRCWRLLADADVLIYNVRPQAMARLGLDYEAVAAINPRIVYAGAVRLSARTGRTRRGPPTTI